MLSPQQRGTGSHPWLKALTNDDGDPERNARLMVTGATIDGVSLRVVELTGQPGDVFVTHPWVMHAAAPNAAELPRMMRSVAVRQLVTKMSSGRNADTSMLGASTT